MVLFPSLVSQEKKQQLDEKRAHNVFDQLKQDKKLSPDEVVDSFKNRLLSIKQGAVMECHRLPRTRSCLPYGCHSSALPVCVYLVGCCE